MTAETMFGAYAFVAILVGVGLGLSFSRYETKLKTFRNIVIALLIASTFFGACAFATYFNATSEYNNGNCEKCDGHYELFDMEYRGDSIMERYIYKCDTCGKTISIGLNMEN